MRSSDIVAALLEKTATLGLSLNRRPQPRLEQHLFLHQRYGFFCGKHHPLFGRSGLAEGDLQSENFVSFTSDQIGGMLSPLTIFRDQQGFSGRIVASSSAWKKCAAWSSPGLAWAACRFMWWRRMCRTDCSGDYRRMRGLRMWISMCCGIGSRR